MKIHFLNTIWSDAIIIENNKHFCFCDCGSKFYYPMIDEYLKKQNSPKIDFILLTHFHSDHYGCIVNIINDYDVDKLYMKEYHPIEGSTSGGDESMEEYLVNQEKCYKEIIDVCKDRNVEIVFLDKLGVKNFEIPFTDASLQCFDVHNRLFETYNDQSHEFYQTKRFNENFNSIGVFLEYNSKHIFLGADVTNSNTNIVNFSHNSLDMVKKYYEEKNIDRIDIYKSCHHGCGSNDIELMKLINPKYVIITNTDRWLDKYETIPNLICVNKGVKIFKTDYHQYVFTIGKRITIKQIDNVSPFIILKKD